MTRWLILAFGLLVVFLLLLYPLAHAQHAHPAADIPLHEQFYSNWMMPDQPTKSCCNKNDCYPTVVKYERGNLYAKRREDGRWLLIPPKKIEHHRDNPDGRNHICAPPPGTAYPDDTVFCFALGGAT